MEELKPVKNLTIQEAIQERFFILSSILFAPKNEKEKKRKEYKERFLELTKKINTILTILETYPNPLYGKISPDKPFGTWYKTTEIIEDL